VTPAAVRFSTLKAINQSPAHYLHARDTEREATRAMRLGTIVDRQIFGGELVTFGGSRSGKAWEAFKLEHEGSEIVTAAEVSAARPMAEAIRANPMAMEWLSGTHQETLYWTFMGRACRSTPDSHNRAKRRVVDLKSTRTSDPRWFVRDALRMNYHAQLAFYGMALGLTPEDDHVLVAVESSAPYCVTVLRLTERAVIAGRKLCHLWMERLLACEAANEWPGYAQSIVDFDVPDELELDFGDDEEIETDEDGEP